jgi:2-iminobutanoate/2-iminopropanoate deaminase
VSDLSSPPTPVGPYRSAVRAGEWIICSGQLGLCDGELVGGGVAPQLRQAIENLKSVLAAEGALLSHIVKTTVFLTEMATFDEMNSAYVEAFGEIRPARSAIGVVALPRGGAVEIEAWARVP